MVFATPVKVSAPIKFMTAANIIACLGFRAFVETAVAIAFAVSWNPLIKSNAKAKMTIKIVKIKIPSICQSPYAFFIIMVSNVFATF